MIIKVREHSGFARSTCHSLNKFQRDSLFAARKVEACQMQWAEKRSPCTPHSSKYLRIQRLIIMIGFQSPCKASRRRNCTQRDAEASPFYEPFDQRVATNCFIRDEGDCWLHSVKERIRIFIRELEYFLTLDKNSRTWFISGSKSGDSDKSSRSLRVENIGWSLLQTKR